MAEEKRKFALSVPLDASRIDPSTAGDAEETQALKVVTKDRNGTLASQTIKINIGKSATATFGFAEHPGPLQVAVGPGDATDEEILGLQTLGVHVPTRKWADQTKLEIPPVAIAPYYWYWWLRWCRTFTIRGKVACPDGSPVPGAQVCAFDVDWWFFWSSKQLVGCDVTDIDGTFEITFRWCCGWWPWWWWRLRTWQLDDFLHTRIDDVLRRNPELQLSRIDQQPNLAVFEKILDSEDLTGTRALKAADVGSLQGLRDRLLLELPEAPELEAFKIWPWYPWYPWWDCTPDIIFKVTQDCDAPGTVILEETIANARWNIDNPLDVNLVVSDEACCIPWPCPNPPCGDTDCVVIDTVCGYPFSNVGGNPGAAATPVGYLNPGPVPINTNTYHRPFGGIIPIRKNPEDLDGFDYYEIEVFDDDPMVLDWVALPPGAAVDFHRRYWDYVSSPPGKPASFQFQNISGHNVVETRGHYESNDPHNFPDEPGVDDAAWLSTNYSLLLPLDTTKFNDGTYRFRVIGWQESGGVLTNRTVLPVCGSTDENEFVLTFDNRVTNAVASHDPTHHCGQGVHFCTTEPDTHILAVRFDGVQVDPCDTIGHTPGTVVEIDFLVTDSDSHLGYYVLKSSWGLNQSQHLLNKPGASVVPLVPGTPSGWAPGQTQGNYGTALSQGALAPHWQGGTYRLTLPLEQAFPEPCCYQLELWAWKRTIVGHGSSCNGYWYPDNGNRTEYSLGVGVCPPLPIPASFAEETVPSVPGVVERERST